MASPPACIAGVDEAGRGPLAGPVVAAAVILPDSPRIHDLNDSKVLTPALRERLFGQIMANAVSVTVSVVSHEIIDRVNILQAALRAMRECVSQLNPRPELVLVDGNQAPRSGLPERTVVKGDGLSACIMAASIIAKVTRDRLMVEAHEKYPQYFFNEHKGYGAPKHLEALRLYGPCPIHRRTFEPMRSWFAAQLVPS